MYDGKWLNQAEIEESGFLRRMTVRAAGRRAIAGFTGSASAGGRSAEVEATTAAAAGTVLPKLAARIPRRSFCCRHWSG